VRMQINIIKDTDLRLKVTCAHIARACTYQPTCIYARQRVVYIYYVVDVKLIASKHIARRS
jgi:hypothetical protein